MNSANAAPWPDYAGNPIHEGDTIRHPDGAVGRVILLDEPRRGEFWFVDYSDWLGLLMLRLQVGDKGQAVVVNDPNTRSE